MSRYDECVLCERTDLKVGESEYSNIHGTVCLNCMREEHPDHLFIGDNHTLRDEDIDTSFPTGGTGALVVHTPTGIAAHCSRHPTAEGNRRAALKLLRKIHSDVRTVERNERYGNCME